jgi:L-serine dehydratase
MTSLFDLYKIGVGPSSSHTMGPMTAAFRFADDLAAAGRLASVRRVQVDLYGSLALTGIGHATDRAILLGLSGNSPAGINPEDIEPIIRQVRTAHRLTLSGKHAVDFQEDSDLLFHRDQMFPPGAITQHPNGMRFTAFDEAGTVIVCRTWFSIGGGFIVEDGQETTTAAQLRNPVPYPFRSAAELLERSNAYSLSIAEIMLANEVAILPDQGSSAIPAEVSIRQRILSIWRAMQDCVTRGIATEGILPGGLNVRRRAHRLAERLRERQQEQRPSDPLAPLDWVTVYAMAVNEENAAGGRVITAPTNGAAGVVPAVALYYNNFIPGANEEGILRFFLTSAAIGILYKENASISGAEVGCQGEVGVACSMAAGGLAAALGGTAGQIEHAAEIAMEHNLGMTCDPIGGLVQIPCIERNAMGAVKAVHATRIAMQEPEEHKVSLDQVIRTMYLTGLDMQSRYKETSLAGLALNIIEC